MAESECSDEQNPQHCPKKKNKTIVMRTWVLFYVVLCLLRIALICAPGYVHPDEFFQSPDAFSSHPAWEFRPEHALRSPVFPWLFSRVPYLCLGTWWAPRVVPLVLSFFVDVWIFRSASSSALLVHASSWPTLVLLSRSFSNSLEASFLCLFMLFSKYPRWALIVAVCATFARFTFPLFSIFSVFILLKQHATSFPRFLHLVFPTLLCAALLIACDSFFYGRLVLTPLNAVLYNAAPGNAASHGRHFFFTHALVNGPLLLGLPCFFRAIRMGEKEKLLTFLPALLALSLIPHQEPRFLLGLLAPVIVMSVGERPLSRWEWGLHLAHHLGVGFFFAILHQAGVVRSLVDLNGVVGHVAYWKTYSPPHYFHNISVVDLMGKSSALESVDCTLVAPLETVPKSLFSIVQCWGPHVSTEAWPSSWAAAQLCQFVKKK